MEQKDHRELGGNLDFESPLNLAGIMSSDYLEIVDQFFVCFHGIESIYSAVLSHAENRMINNKPIILFRSAETKLARLKSLMQILQVYLNKLIDDIKKLLSNCIEPSVNKQSIDMEIQCVLVYFQEFIINAVGDAYHILGASGYMVANQGYQEWEKLERMLSNLLRGRIDYRYCLLGVIGSQEEKHG